MNTALTCNMTHVVAPQLPSGDMFAAWFRVCKLDYKFSPGECGYVVPGTPSNTKKAINSTNSTQDDVKEENKKAKTVVEGEQEVETAPHTRAVKNLGDAGAGDEAYLLHDKFFSKREGIQPAAITYRLNAWERLHRSDCATSGAPCKTKLVQHAKQMIATEVRKKAADGFKYMRGFNTWYENAKIPGGLDCSAFFAFGVSVCNKGGSVSVRCDIDGEETKGGLEFGCGCDGVYLQGVTMGYMPESIAHACANKMQQWTQKAEQTFMRTRQAERCVAKAARRCKVVFKHERNGKQMIKDKGLITIAKKQLSLHQFVRSISKANVEAEKEKRKLIERLANPVYTYVKIPGFGVHASGVKSSQAACRDQCNRQPTCKSFSYNKHTEGCALSGTTIDVNDNYVLFVRQNAAEWHSTTFTEIPGMSFAPEDKATDIAVTASQCKLDCLSNKDCNAVSYSKLLKKCLISKSGLHLGSDWDYYEKQKLDIDSNESVQKNNAKLHLKEMKIKVMRRNYKLEVEADNLAGAPG